MEVKWPVSGEEVLPAAPYLMPSELLTALFPRLPCGRWKMRRAEVAEAAESGKRSKEPGSAWAECR